MECRKGSTCNKQKWWLKTPQRQRQQVAKNPSYFKFSWNDTYHVMAKYWKMQKSKASPLLSHWKIQNIGITNLHHGLFCMICPHPVKSQLNAPGYQTLSHLSADSSPELRKDVNTGIPFNKLWEEDLNSGPPDCKYTTITTRPTASYTTSNHSLAVILHSCFSFC